MRTPSEIRQAALALMKDAAPLDAAQQEARWGALIRSCPSGPRQGEPWLPLLMELAQRVGPRVGLSALPVAIRVLKEADLPLDAPNAAGRNALDLALKEALSCVGQDMSVLTPWVQILMNLTRHGLRQTAGSGLLPHALQEGHMGLLVQVLLESGSDPNAPYAPGRSCFQEVLAHQTGYLTNVPMACWIKAGVDAAHPEVRQHTAERLVNLMQTPSELGGPSMGGYLNALGEVLSWGQVDWRASVHPEVSGWPCPPLSARLDIALGHFPPERRAPHHSAFATIQARLLEAGLPPSSASVLGPPAPSRPRL